MARPITLTKTLTAADADNICLVQAKAAAGNLTINGAAAAGGVATLDTARRVLVTSGGNDSAISFTIYGKVNGTSIQETVTGANAGSVATNQDFDTVTRVAASGAVATTVQVGTNTVGSTRWVLLNNHITEFQVGAQGEILSGAANWTMEVTEDSVMMPIPIYETGYSQAMPVPVAVGWSGMTAQAGTATSTINQPVRAARLTVNSGTGNVQLTLVPAGIRN